MYVCGPTVYDFCHMGHAKTAVSFDIIRRFLAYEGYNVFYISNITDVGHIVGDADIGEDKIEKRAKERQVNPMELVDFYIRSMWRDYDALRIQRPNIAPRATGHIVEMIEAVKTILDKGYAYEYNGNIYFDVDKFLKDYKKTDFGKLSGRKIKKQLAGVRNKVAPGKKKPYDFALWKKASRGHIMRWQSPWGEGFPGWHIECTVMSTKYLGQPFDIHGGGIEHAMLHHECEILQAEALREKKFVRYWLHTGLLNIEGQKMSKSKGNFVTIKDVLKKYRAEVIRMLILQTHYRKPLNYTKSSFEVAKRNVEKISQFRDFIKHITCQPSRKTKAISSKLENTLSALTKQARKDFKLSMEDDFNTPKALAAILDYVSKVYRTIGERKLTPNGAEVILGFLREIDSVLAILIPEQATKQQGTFPKILDDILELREKLRRKGDWETADRLRTILNKAGIEIEDTSSGPRVVRKI